MTGDWWAIDDKVRGIYDISRAYHHSPARRTIVVKIPREDDECKRGDAVLDKTVRTSDAAQCFDVASENAMTAMGFDTGSFSPCLYHSSAADMSVFRHGDFFLWREAREHKQKEFEEQVSKHLTVKHLLTLGPCTALGDVTEVRILNRIVRIRT